MLSTRSPLTQTVAGLLLAAALVLAGCDRPRPVAAASESPPDPPPAPATAAPSAAGPYVRVLGTAQDGGLPHAACDCGHCRAARSDPARRRLVASLGVVLPASGRVLLVDATPDLREQLDTLADVRQVPGDGTDRTPVDGVLLTHAHIGHYLGLAFFGYEAVATRDLPVYCTPSMAAFLRDNAPWDRLVSGGHIELVEVAPGEAVDLGDGVTARAVASPHRHEYTDTVGWLLSGPRASVLYVPDTDGWDAWDRPLPEILAGVDVALVDGTFYSPDELPGRRVEQIGHPLITDTMQRLAGDSSTRVLFTHLNHSNPALEPEGPAAAEIEARGFAVASDGLELPL